MLKRNRLYERSPWRLLLAGGLGLALLYVLLPYGLTASALYVLATLAAAVTVTVAVYREKQLFCSLAWKLIAMALVLAAIGHGIWYWLDLVGLEPFPSAADIFYLAIYPLFMMALWLLGKRKNTDDSTLSDALIIGISAGVLGWALLIEPYVNAPDITLLQLLVSTAYPVADLILLPMILHLVFLQRTRITAHTLLLAGMLAYLAADMLYAHGNSAGWYGPGGFTDGLWLVAYSLFVAAVWHPSSSEVPTSHASTARLSSQRLFILGTASVFVPALILLTVGTEIGVVRVAAFASILLFLLIMHRMAGLIRETQHQAERLERLSRMDPLTGASNRRDLEYQLKREVARAERLGTTLCLAFLDLDYFKDFNDTYGHPAGDALLQNLVDAWQSDLRPTDMLARIGGEEFVIIFPDTDIEQCQKAVERLRKLIPRGQTCSAGLAVFAPGETADELINRADRALYLAKNTGRDRVVRADDGPSLNRAAQKG
ncbi:GGDEF domain-containing protein [Methylohalomonas lacus]|nr:GGDEF domain-containing protein [Methylohalomonas lacus]